MKKKKETVKRTRVSLYERGPLYIDPKYKRSGFVCRWVNDKDGNLEKFMDLGYTSVKRHVEVGDEVASNTHPLGGVVTKNVGGGLIAVLMEIPVEIYKSIQNEKEQMNRDYESSIKRLGIPTQFSDIQTHEKD